MATTYESFTSTSLAAVTVVDNFVQLRGTAGQFPPPIGSVVFQLTARLPISGPVPLNPPIVLSAQTNGYGVFLFTGQGTIGSSALLTIPADRYTLRVTSDYYQDFSLDLDWPPSLAAPPLIALRPAYAYPFPDLTMVSNQLTLLRGNLYQPGGDRRPIAGATVSIASPANTWPFASCTTDSNGGWVLAIPLGSASPALNATLHFVLPDNTAFDVAGVPLQTGAENSLPQTALRGSVLTPTDAPVAGATIAVANIAGTSTTGRDGAWSFYMSLVQPAVQALVTATAPSGHNQSQNVQILNRATVLVPAFRIVPN